MIQIIYSTALMLVCVVLYWFVFPVSWRRTFLLVSSIGFISLFSIPYAIFFVVNVAAVYLTGKYMKEAGEKKLLILKMLLVWLIGSLCAFKYGHLLLNTLFQFNSQLFNSEITKMTVAQLALPLGLSYVVFRLIHYSVEMYRNKLPSHTFQDFGLYVFFFPTFIAGPVERFQRFHPQTESIRSIKTEDINYGLLRVITGFVRKFFIADNLIPIIMTVLTSPDDYSKASVILTMYGLGLWLYMDFGGYSDMAIGVSRLFGYKIMENFNNPLFKNNIADLWRNWHISVYSFIRDYFFLPLFGFRATQLKIYVGIFMTMILFMLWHEGSMTFLLLGIYYGSGLVLWQIFQEFKRKHKGIRKIVDSKYFNPVSIFITLTHWSFGIIFMVVDTNQVKNIIKTIIL